MWKLVFIAAFSVIWAIAVSEDYVTISEGHVTKKNGCNTTTPLMNPTGSFELNLHNRTTCYWEVGSDPKKNETEPISLFFMFLILHPDDVVTIYENRKDANASTNPITDPIRTQNGSLTFVTEKSFVVVKYEGKADYVRKFEVIYNHGCLFPVAPDIEIIHSPTYVNNVTKSVECTYDFNKIQHFRVKQVLTFEEFNLTDSVVSFEGSTLDGQYKNDNPEDIFIDLKKAPMKLTTKIDYNSSDYFRIKIHLVDLSCSDKIELNDEEVLKVIKSPPEVLNNGSIVAECRWVIKHNTKSKVLGLKFDKLNFNSVFDIIAVNDGLSELSTPLLQVTSSNRNLTKSQLIRSTGNYLWVSFKPLTYASSFSANITVHGQGGYFKKSGTIHMGSTSGDDTVFLLEVDDGKNVILDFTDSSFSYPATLSVYDGFDTSHLLTSLHGQIKYPIVSKSSRMMIIATQFNGPYHFTADFQEMDPGCLHMSTLSVENYILSGKCNSTCMWIVPPQDTVNSVLLLELQYISLKEGDSLEILRLDPQLTQLGMITANKTHVPHLSLPANIGALVKVVQAPCSKQEEKIILIGHSSYMPACNYTIKPNIPGKFQISSPLYPDTYPVFSSCYWNITASEGKFFHLAFQELKIAKNHCLKIIQSSSKTNITYVGESLPDDLFLHGDVSIEFDSSNCDKKVEQTLNNDVGFLLNVTVADCGAVLDGRKSGEFNTSTEKNKSICIWKVTVPPTDKDSVNIITYSFTKKDDWNNYNLHVYDGSSVRSNEIFNESTSDTIWSRTNTLIFIYERLNVSKPSSILLFKYNTFSCNKSMQCENKICMHPDWRCNKNNDCGDFSDERNCESVPVAPDVKPSGYSGLTLGLCIFVMLIVGLGLGIGLPVCYQKYKDARYTRFRELSGIDG